MLSSNFTRRPRRCLTGREGGTQTTGMRNDKLQAPGLDPVPTEQLSQADLPLRQEVGRVRGRGRNRHGDNVFRHGIGKSRCQVLRTTASKQQPGGLNPFQRGPLSHATTPAPDTAEEEETFQLARGSSTLSINQRDTEAEKL